eukprot:PhF_6_TR33521/c0_g1_i1/m.48860
MSSISQDSVTNFISAFIALCYFALASYCCAILYTRLRQRQKKLQRAQQTGGEQESPSGTAAGASFAATNRTSSSLARSPSNGERSSVTLSLISPRHNPFNPVHNEGPSKRIFDVGCAFYTCTAAECAARCGFFLFSVGYVAALTSNSPLQFETFGIADALFPCAVFILLYLWYKTCWEHLVSHAGLEEELLINPFNVPRIIRFTAVVVIGSVVFHAVLAVSSAFGDLSKTSANLVNAYVILTYVCLSIAFVVIASHIRRAVSFLPIFDDRAGKQARRIWRVSIIMCVGLGLRALAVCLQFVTAWNNVVLTPYFSQGFYFLFDFCLLTVIVSSVHSKGGRQRI